MIAGLHAEKRPFRVLRRWRADGEPHVEYEADFWEGPGSNDDDSVGYRTVRNVVNRMDFRRTVAPSASFHGELSRALS